MCKIQQRLFCSELVKRAPSILEYGELIDCKFVVGAESHQVVVAGYKLVMAMASPVFQAMFYGSLAETKDHIPIVDVEPEIFQAMLRYIYTDNINISSWSEACQIYYAAKKYMLKQLMELCSEYLQTNLNAGNVCQIYEHSLLFEDDALTQHCIKVFSEDTKDLLKDNSFIAADINTITTIFSLDALNLDSELDLIEAAARYTKAQDIKSKEETSVGPVMSTTTDEVSVSKNETSICPVMCTTTDEVSVSKNETSVGPVMSTTTDEFSMNTELADCGPSNLKFDTAEKQLIRSAVRNIRFLTLTPQQYASCAARYSLLTLSEDHAVIMNIVSDESDVPLPSDFSTLKIDRVFKASLLFRIDGFHSGNTVYSQAHCFRKLKWQIRFTPSTYIRRYDGVNYRVVEPDCANLTLLCTDESQSSSWSCDASVELRIISQTPDLQPLICNIQHVFTQHQTECTFDGRFLYNDFVENNYLKDACAEMEVLIKINKLADTAEKQLIRSAVRNIRFLTLTSQQYADCASRYSLLTLLEDHAVLMNIASNKSDVPMPSGFSTVKVDRIFKTSFFFRIDDFHSSKSNTVFSQAHCFRKLKWQIRLKPYMSFLEHDCLNLTLLCTDDSQSSSWSCDASVKLRIISQTPDVQPMICNIQHVFSQHQREYTIPHGYFRDDFIYKKYLKDDSVEMEVLIKINKLVGI